MSHRIYRENDNIYININIGHEPGTFNTNPAIAPSGTGETIAEYSVNKTQPILDKASDYYCSIIRFDIPLATVPIFIMPIIPNQPNPLLTPLIFGINMNGVKRSVYLRYLPDGIFDPPVQNQTSQVINTFYYVYSYDTLINMINYALANLYIICGLNAPAMFPTTNPPYMYLDPATQLISFIVPKFFTEVTAPLSFIPTIYINEPMINYLNSFQYFYNGDNRPDGDNFVFVFNNLVTQNPYVLANPGLLLPNNVKILPRPDQGYYLSGVNPVSSPLYIQYIESFSTVVYWSSLKKILITTSTIPVSPEFIQPNLNSAVSSSLPVITDFTPIIQSSNESRSIAYYNPSGQYRLVDMISDSPLQKINVKIYWEDNNSNIYPLTISLYQTISIKMAFLRKTLYKQSNLLLK